MGISENCAVAPGCCGPDLLYYIQAWEAPKDLGKQSAFILIIFPILREGRAVHTWQKDKTGNCLLLADRVAKKPIFCRVY